MATETCSHKCKTNQSKTPHSSDGGNPQTMSDILQEVSRTGQETARSEPEMSGTHQEAISMVKLTPRAAHETSRASRDTTRQGKETSRTAPETPRAAKETEVSGQEPARRAKDMSRTAQETSRTTQETSRIAQETSRAAQETSRTGQETARTQRSQSRTTLQPSVQDFNGKIIKRAVDEDQVVWTVGATQLRLLHPLEGNTYPVPASVPRSSTFTALQWDSLRLPLVPNTSRSERVAAWTEDVHRRHVARTARARARLSAKPKMLERVVPTTPSGIVDNFDKAINLSSANNASAMDDVHLAYTSRQSSRTDGAVTARPRPATTGRYFNTSNGLRNIRSSTVRARPNTAAHWAGPGLRINKLTLHSKELVT